MILSHLQQSLSSVVLVVRHWPPGIANKGCEGILSNYDYDKAGQLTLENRRQTSGLTLIHSNYFTYDAAGNRSIWQRVESGVDESAADPAQPQRWAAERPGNQAL